MRGVWAICTSWSCHWRSESLYFSHFLNLLLLECLCVPGTARVAPFQCSPCPKGKYNPYVERSKCIPVRKLWYFLSVDSLFSFFSLTEFNDHRWYRRRCVLWKRNPLHIPEWLQVSEWDLAKRGTVGDETRVRSPIAQVFLLESGWNCSKVGSKNLDKICLR